MHILKYFDELFFLFFTMLVLVLITSIDFIIHEVLYNYGLIFDYTWAIPYWYILTLLFWAVSFLGISAYFIDRNRADKSEGILIFITSIAAYHGGLLDTIFFIIERLIRGTWGKAFSNWWWHPFSSWFGYWDLNFNIILNIVTIIGLLIGWYLVNRGE